MRRSWLAVASAAALGLPLACSSSPPNGAGGSASSSSSSGAPATSSSASSSSSTGTTSSSGGGGGTGGGPVYAPSGFSCTSSKVSLQTDVAPITTANCATTGCHVAMNTGPNITDQLVGRIAEECPDLRFMVDPGHPEASYVIHKLTGKNLEACDPATTMPLNKAMLPAAHVQTIYDWICEGAPNN